MKDPNDKKDAAQEDKLMRPVGGFLKSFPDGTEGFLNDCLHLSSLTTFACGNKGPGPRYRSKKLHGNF